MSTNEIRDYLENFDLCSICILRYGHETLQTVDISKLILENPVDINKTKRLKPNTCSACLGIFQNLDSVANEIVANSSLKNYQCESLYSSIQIPIVLLIRELSIWMALIEKFPEQIDGSMITTNSRLDIL